MHCPDLHLLFEISTHGEEFGEVIRLFVVVVELL